MAQQQNLVQELGSAYIVDRFHDSMFYDDEKRPSFIDTTGNWPNGKLKVKTLTDPRPEKPIVVDSVLPWSFFKDMSVFSTPPLGWRMAAEGRYLAYFRRNNRSYHRGIAPHILTRWISPATQLLLDTENLSYGHYEQNVPTVGLIMAPAYVRLREGIEAMRRGDLFSFAASPTVAVIPAPEDKQSIYFNTNKVGEVDAKGNIKCASQAIEEIIKDHE